jgi:methylglyoxal synthase
MFWENNELSLVVIWVALPLKRLHHQRQIRRLTRHCQQIHLPIHLTHSKKFLVPQNPQHLQRTAYRRQHLSRRQLSRILLKLPRSIQRQHNRLLRLD